MLSEQETVKQERSATNQSCRLSYDGLIANVKAFVHHFSSLTDEEKMEYKSLSNHVKQLTKCNEVIKKLSTPVRCAISPKVNIEMLDVLLKTPRSKRNSKSSDVKEEQSPTAQVVATAVVNEQKKGRSRKTEVAGSTSDMVVVSSMDLVPTPDAVEDPVVEETMEPVKKPVSKRNASKSK